MSKFNLFDESTWEETIDRRAIEKRIKNRAIGAIGQKISELRSLQSALIKLSPNHNNTEYVVAKDLLHHHPKAAQLMDVKINLPADKQASKLHHIQTLINEVLTAWQDADHREHLWRSLIPKLQELEPYIEEHRSTAGHYSPEWIKLSNLVDARVSGNEAWEVYLTMFKSNTIQRAVRVNRDLNENDEDDYNDD